MGLDKIGLDQMGIRLNGLRPNGNLSWENVLEEGNAGQQVMFEEKTSEIGRRKTKQETLDKKVK